MTQILDLIATECPDPALLLVDTPRSIPSDRAEPRYTLLRLEIASVVTDATGAEAVSVRDLLAARSVPAAVRTARALLVSSFKTRARLGVAPAFVVAGAVGLDMTRSGWRLGPSADSPRGVVCRQRERRRS